eukprot:1142093-Pyramimonas_sp.AAC.1
MEGKLRPSGWVGVVVWWVVTQGGREIVLSQLTEPRGAQHPQSDSSPFDSFRAATRGCSSSSCRGASATPRSTSQSRAQGL